jgi:hypothetical protein
MATIEDLVTGIQRIQGLGGYVIVNQDGQVLSHNVANVEGLSALIVMGALCVRRTKGSWCSPSAIFVWGCFSGRTPIHRTS